VADDSAGIQVVDISDTGTPVIAASYDTPGRAFDLTIDGDYIYVADTYSLMILHFDRETGTIEQPVFTPSDFNLGQNYPNPFNNQTIIRFFLPKSQNLNLTIYDLLGRQVHTLINGFRKAGSHTIPFDASDLSSGVYFYRLQAGDVVETKRMVLLK
jgi:hypothetical protein